MDEERTINIEDGSQEEEQQNIRAYACGGSENVVAVRIAAPATSWAVGARAEAQTVQPFC